MGRKEKLNSIDELIIADLQRAIKYECELIDRAATLKKEERIADLIREAKIAHTVRVPYSVPTVHIQRTFAFDSNIRDLVSPPINAGEFIILTRAGVHKQIILPINSIRRIAEVPDGTKVWTKELKGIHCDTVTEDISEIAEKLGV